MTNKTIPVCVAQANNLQIKLATGTDMSYYLVVGLVCTFLGVFAMVQYRIARRNRITVGHIILMAMITMCLVIGAGSIPFAALVTPFAPASVVLSVAFSALACAGALMMIGFNVDL